jgi:nucleoside-diphosphate-sugar epimerase
MSKGTVLVSGVNGYIGAVLAKHLLDNDYNVRGAVRRLASAETLTSGPLKTYAESGAFTVVEVPDITADGAFDKAVEGVTAIAHLASPVSFTVTDPEPIIHAAVNGTKSILESALHAGPQLKSFAVLSSIASVRNFTPAPYTFTEKDWNDWAEPAAAAQGKDAPWIAVYAASKVAAEKAFWAFRDEKKPSFAMTALNPVFVIGPPLITPQTVAEIGGTIRPIWNAFSGGEFPPPGMNPGVGDVVDVRDVAAQIEHIIAHPEQTNGERYISAASITTPQSLVDVLRKAFPDAEGRIVKGTPGQGYSPDYQILDKENEQVTDGSKAKALLSSGEYIPHEKSVIDTAKSFVHLI